VACGRDEHPLIRTLHETIQQANADIHNLGLAAKALADRPAEVADLLLSCMSETGRWRPIADRAYHHPNGFAKFVLYDPAGSLFNLRLHVWTGEDAHRQLQADQNVHGHRWDFGSVVIAGPGLRIDEYAISDTAGVPYRSYAYRPRPDADTHRGAELAIEGAELEPVGLVLLERSFCHTPNTRDTYTCDVDKLHTVQPVSPDLTATLVVQGPALKSSAPVFRRPDQLPQPAARPMNDAQARRVLTDTIAAVTDPGGVR
jgi:hypothetical protein